ncbi:TIGR03862 family flavoprotein [Breoghania sp. L-A4]|uniref:TIGR03862 family flavoprotein n=1 Tax=Breoghania sp. L-A4 TaxID=2304600 RepID=UPI000E35B440|nr:TIGR03862 family flavoprotein [Breoghania sp. L-A4]AXS39334.1 TIGR03862 family flavoprotein [Breoghania sp. L-A4]
MSETTSSPTVAIIGAGPAGLIAAETLARASVTVSVYDAMPSPARKFLMAGRGGLNLTHSEELDTFLTHYGDARAVLEPMIRAFGPDALRQWCEDLGEETFVGSSKRVFPKSMKASPLLRAWLKRLGDLGVTLHPRHRWTGWNDGALTFETPDGPVARTADATLLALGGASWPRLGSTGAWTAILAAHDVPVTPLAPANCGFDVAWSDVFSERFAGRPLKTVTVSFDGRAVRGDAMITAHGIEGGAVYALSAPLREAIARDGPVPLAVDLRPDMSLDALIARLSRPRGKQSQTAFLRKAAGLAPEAIGLLREAAGKDLPTEPEALARLVKSATLTLTATRPIDRAISSAGGVSRAAVDSALMLRTMEGVFVAGEMLDWEAPTGGYLLQACFSTGVTAAQGMLSFMKGTAPQQ